MIFYVKLNLKEKVIDYMNSMINKENYNKKNDDKIYIININNIYERFVSRLR